MPSRSNHLVQRGTVWHARIDVPADLRPAFGNRRILSKSLRTGDKRLAQELASTQVGQWKAEFRAIRDAKIRSGDQWREELARAAKTHHSQTDEILLSTMKGTLGSEYGSAPLDELREARDEVRDLLEQLAQTMGIPDALNDWDAIMGKDGVHETDRMHQLREAQLLALVQGAQNTWLLKGDEIGEAQAIAKDPSTYKPKSPISSTSIERFSEFYLTQNDNVRTRDVYVAKVTKLSTWLTTNGKELNFDSVAEFLDSVGKQRQTRTGYLAAFRRYHEWACRYDTYYRGIYADAKNPFDNHTHPKVGANAGNNWDVYKREEAERLHTAALAKGDTDLADLIVFACYTGCRIEELGRIRRETTVFDKDGTPISFKVDDAKTKAGLREVPIHSALLPMYVRRLEAPQGSHDFLFASSDKHKHGLRLNALGQRFTKLKRAEGFGDRHVFHSFRRCTVTQLHQNGADQSVIPYIVGHEIGLLTYDLYSDGPEFSKKKEAIEKLVFNFT